MRVMIAGLAGASLGTEIVKCLEATGQYDIFGCDISPLAYGMYSMKINQSFVVDIATYIDSIIGICKQNNIQFLVPGGEQPMVLLAASYSRIKESGINLVCNTNEIVKLFSDKKATFEFLRENGFSIPKTISIENGDISIIDEISFPCIVKPSSGTGGSDSVFLATSKDECVLYSELLMRNNRPVLIQEYIDLDEGEFTIGVLSDTNSNIISSVAMQRIFNSKLSVSYKGKKGLISSGYSQGLISDFPELRRQAEAIAIAADSRGPLNIQGRVKNGILIPFEINPRFSSTVLFRHLLGFKDVIWAIESKMEDKIDAYSPPNVGSTFYKGFSEYVLTPSVIC